MISFCFDFLRTPPQFTSASLEKYLEVWSRDHFVIWYFLHPPWDVTGLISFLDAFNAEQSTSYFLTSKTQLGPSSPFFLCLKYIDITNWFRRIYLVSVMWYWHNSTFSLGLVTLLENVLSSTFISAMISSIIIMYLIRFRRTTSQTNFCLLAPRKEVILFYFFSFVWFLFFQL